MKEKTLSLDSLLRSRTPFKYPPAFLSTLLRISALVISKAFWFIRFQGVNNIPESECGYVVASNHQTYIDPVWISIAISSKLRYMAWDQAFGWPLIGPLIRYFGAFPVAHRASITKSAVVESLTSLRDGAALIVFPEGEREFADGRMLEFKPGALHIALHAGVPVLPVTIRGANRIWPQGQRYPSLFRRVDVIFHELMRVAPLPEGSELRDHLEAENGRLRSTIEAVL